MTDNQLLVLELITCAIEMQFVLRYYNSVYGSAGNMGRLRLLAVPYSLAFTVALKLLVLQPHNSASLPVFTVLAGLVFLPFLPGRWEKKLLFSIVLIGVSLAWTHFGELITSLNRHWHIGVRYLSFHAGFWVLLELLGRFGKKEYQSIPRPMWLLLASIAFLNTAVCYSIAVDWNRTDSILLQTSDFLVLIAFVLINAALFLFYERFSQLLQQVREQSLLEQQLSLQGRHFRELEAYQREIAALHHDMRNTIGTAAGLARSGAAGDKLAGYLEAVNGSLEQIRQTVTTGNPGMDSVLDLKLSQLRRAGVRCETDLHVPAGLPVGFEDSVAIFGNLLDNALEACERLSQADRWVHITLSYSNGSLYIKVDNPLPQGEALREGEPLPTTTKANRRIHGYGLKNIARAVEHRGAMTIDRSRPGVFSVRILLYGL